MESTQPAQLTRAKSRATLVIDPELQKRMVEMNLSGESLTRIARTFRLRVPQVRSAILAMGSTPVSKNEPDVPDDQERLRRIAEVHSRWSRSGSDLEAKRRARANAEEWGEAFRLADQEGTAVDRWWDIAEEDLNDRERPLVGGFVPRAFQVEAERAVIADFDAGHSRVLCVSPTGTGKTELGFLIGRNYKSRLLIFPTIELTHQTLKRARLRWPDAAVDLEQGASQAVTTSDTICASMQSLLSRRRYEKFLGRTELVMVDEAHWGFTETQHRMLDAFVAAGAKIVGLTATPFVQAHGGILSWWQKVSYQYTIRQATDDGLLVPAAVTQLQCREMDLSAFRVGSGSDYNAIELDRILRREKVALEMAEAVVQHYHGQCSIVFAHSISQAEKLLEILKVRYGIKTGLVHSKMQPADRNRMMESFFAGDILVMLNVGVLILGFDWPNVRNVFMCKPTASRARYMQMFGRGTRPLPNTIDNPVWGPQERRAAIAASAKPNFSVYDMTDNCQTHSLCSALDVLAPEIDEAVKVRVKIRLQREKCVTAEAIDEIVAEEAKEEARRLAAVEKLEAERRASLKARSVFDRTDRDPYAPAGKPRPFRGMSMPFGKHKGKPVRAVDTPYLEYITANYKMQAKLRDAINAELARRAEVTRAKRQAAEQRRLEWQRSERQKMFAEVVDRRSQNV